MTHPSSYSLRPFDSSDRYRIQQVRQQAFRSVWASWRELVGEDVFRLAYGDADRKQAAYLDEICASSSEKEVYVLLYNGSVIGFLALAMDDEKHVGEIDLNAVDPEHQGRGAGTFMYQAGLARLKEKGALLAKVSTGGDASHEPARRAYAKVGFSVGVPGVMLFRRL